MNDRSYKLLLVDDEFNVLNALKRLLRQHKNWDIETFTLPEEALKRAHVTPFDVILSDYKMPVMDGVKFLTEMGMIQPLAVRIILSAQIDFESLMNSINEAKIYHIVKKPWDNDELVTLIESALEKKDSEMILNFQAESYRDSLDQGENPSIN